MNRSLRLFSILTLSAITLYGCTPADVEQAAASARAASTADTDVTSVATAAPANRSPTITLATVPTATVGQAYLLSPSAADADGDVLTFSIAGKPAWASFDAANGRLSGVPAAGDTGTAGGIVITVSDGKSTTALPAFSVVVAATAVAATGNATLEWDVPTTNTDGSTLADLASFEIVYGRAESELTETVSVADRLATSFQISGLASGTWYFAVKAVNQAGQRSPLSNIASKLIP